MRLRLFGSAPAGAEGYLQSCRDLAAELGLADAVGFEGRVEEIRDAYAAGSVVVLSSISEGFPYTLIEAMTCGRACVATDVGGVSEALGDTGRLVPPRDPEAMAAACLELLGDAELRGRWAPRPGSGRWRTSRWTARSAPSARSTTGSPAGVPGLFRRASPSPSVRCRARGRPVVGALLP